jgi:hypothetical protein
VGAAMMHFAPDAIKVGGARCFPTACTTLAGIRSEWEFDVANHINVKILDLHRHGNTEIARAELRADGFPPGVERIIVVVSAVLRGDQFTAFTAIRDVTDPQTALLSAPR